MLNKFNPRKIKYLKIANAVLSIVYHEKKSTSSPDITKADNILIIDPTLIGDIVMLTPFLRIIRKNNDHCRITLACGKWAKSILESQNLVDEFVVIDSSFLNSIKNLAFDRKKLKEQIKLINTRVYDYALEPRGDLRYIFFMHYCNAKRKVSYSYTGGDCFLTDVIVPSKDVEHLVEDKLYFAEKLGCGFDKARDVFPRLELSKSQMELRTRFIKENGFEDAFIIGMHPGASLENKKWDDYDRLLKLLNASLEHAVFVIFQGPGEDKTTSKIINAAKNCNARYMISCTPIDEYLPRISACNVMICNDSGAGHIAAAYSVPVFVMFGPFYPEIGRPYSNESVVCFSKNIRCKPCMSQTCNNNKECLRLIKPEIVADKIIEFVNLSKGEVD